jgi:alanine-glyoxylate transaminase/serine-glyoxylate transaminase/serine-pyruvate transaminase
MGPGPSDVSPRVLAALSRPTVGHLDPAFQGLMEEIKAALAEVMKAPGYACLPLPAPGTAGMEAALMNLLEPGDTAVIAVNGQFGERMVDMAGRAGAEVVRADQDWGTPVDPAAVEAALQGRKVKLVAMVHAETSTGTLSDPKPVCELAHAAGALTVVDCVTSLGGVDVDAAGWGADVVYSGTQKCLSAPPGLSPFAMSPLAREAVAARREKPRNWLFDMSLIMAYWGGEGGRTYHHTAPINALYGLHEALVVLLDEGLDAAHARHRRMHTAFAAGVEAAGLSFLVEPAHRLPQLNTVRVPDGIDEARVRAHMLARRDLEIGAGLGPLRGKVWRIGLMGASATPWHVRLCLTALTDALAAQNFPDASRAALAAAEAALSPPL